MQQLYNKHHLCSMKHDLLGTRARGTYLNAIIYITVERVLCVSGVVAGASAICICLVGLFVRNVGVQHGICACMPVVFLVGLWGKGTSGGHV